MDVDILSGRQKKPLIIAHRGGSLLERENTIPAYRKSIELKVDIVETDVRETADGIIVSFHDSNLERLAGKKGNIKDFTFEELKKIDPKIPTLEEIISVCKGNVPLIIEVKEKGFEQKLVEIIEKEKVVSEVIVLSFKEDIVRKVKLLNPSIEIGNLVRVRKFYIPWFFYDRYQANVLVKRTLELGAKVLVLNFDFYSKVLLKKCHKNNIAVWLWAVNELNLMNKFIEAGVDGIITDAPDKLINVIS